MVEQTKEKTPQDINDEYIAFTADLSFRNPNTALYNLGAPRDPRVLNLKQDLKPGQIFKKLSFTEVKYGDLPAELQKGLENERNLYGHPLLKVSKDKLDTDVKIFQSKSGDVFYMVKDNGDETYSWSRIQKSEIGYQVQEMENNNNIGGILKRFAFNEIMHAQAPKVFSHYTKNDKVPKLIANEQSGIIGETRTNVKDQVIGTA